MLWGPRRTVTEVSVSHTLARLCLAPHFMFICNLELICSTVCLCSFSEERGVAAQ